MELPKIKKSEHGMLEGIKSKLGFADANPHYDDGYYDEGFDDYSEEYGEYGPDYNEDDFPADDAPGSRYEPYAPVTSRPARASHARSSARSSSVGSAKLVSIDDVRDWAEAHKLELHHWFFSTDLTFYVKGGRISKVAGVFGGLLDICPLLNMDNLGRLIPRSKIRGKKRVMKEIVARMEEHAQGGLDYSGKCYISQSACYDDARAVADEIEKKFPKLNGKVEIYSVGTTIGSHTGPGTMALFFWGDERKD